MNDPWLNRPEEWETIGEFRARVGAAFRTSETRQALGALAAAVAGGGGVPCGRVIRVRAEAVDGGRGCEFLVQRCPVSRRPGASRALRAVDAAERLLGRAVRTPHPVACLLRPAGSGRWEGWAVFQFQPGLMPLRDWIERLLTGQNDFGRAREWARAVGMAIRDLHEAGVFHGKLDAWSVWVDSRKAPREGVRFFELERCVIGAAPGPLARLRDWSALDLPRRLLAEAMGAGLGEGATPAVGRLLRFLRLVVLGVWRLRGRRLPPRVDTACAFLWDAACDGAVDLDREEGAGGASGWRQSVAWLQLGGGARLFAAPEPMLHRLAVGVRAVSGTVAGDVSALGSQGVRDVWVRLCCHDGDERRAVALAAIQNMAKAGFSVSILLVQDRRAVLEPERWVDFVSRALEPVGWQVGRAVYGYAPDEPAWGIRSAAEYRRFLATLPTMRGAYPGTVFAGPACAVTNSRFLARTADAARQAGGWEEWVCRASADWVESETLTDGVWLGQLARFCRGARAASAAAARPILVVEPAGGGRSAATRPSTAEAAEGRLARHVRRTLLAVCSGLVEQVVLMQTPSAGDFSQQVARQDVWRTFLRRLGSGGRCVGRLALGGSETAWLLRFEDADGAPVWLGWSDGAAQIVEAAAVHAERAHDLLGRNAPLLPPPRLRLTEMPAYFDSQPWPAA